jgi:hypothetical protein
VCLPKRLPPAEAEICSRFPLPRRVAAAEEQYGFSLKARKAEIIAIAQVGGGCKLAGRARRAAVVEQEGPVAAPSPALGLRCACAAGNPLLLYLLAPAVQAYVQAYMEAHPEAAEPADAAADAEPTPAEETGAAGAGTEAAPVEEAAAPAEEASGPAGDAAPAESEGSGPAPADDA